MTKAKIEMFKRMLKNEPNEWPEEFKDVYDSIIIEKTDTVDVITDK